MPLGLRALAARYPGMTVGSSADLAAVVDQDRATTNWLLRVLAAIVFAFTAIAVVNTLMMIALHRTRELALLRLVGAHESPGALDELAGRPPWWSRSGSGWAA